MITAYHRNRQLLLTQKECRWFKQMQKEDFFKNEEVEVTIRNSKERVFVILQDIIFSK